MDLNRVRSIGVVCALAATAVTTVCLPATVAAAPTPGVPVAPAAGVPSHGRAWELTTPPAPGGLASFWPGFSITDDGEKVLYFQIGLTPDYPYGTPVTAAILSVRRANGWGVSQVIGPVPGEPAKPLVFGPADTAVWRVEDDKGRGSLYLQDRAGGFEKLADEATFLGASADLQRVIFTSSSHLLPGDASRTEGASIYERDGAGLRLLDVAAGWALISQCGGSSDPLAAIDARRVYFTARPNCEGSVRLYLAELGTGVREVSASTCSASCGQAADVSLVKVSRDSSGVLLSTVEKLSDDDENSHADLYRYDAEDDELTLITSGAGRPDLVPRDGPLQTGSQIGSGWLSSDASRIYFYAAQVTGPEEAGETALYLADASGVHLLGSAATTTLINASADGRHALLNSTAPLAPGDGDGLMDVYRYDAASGDFTRISRGPLGGNGAFAAAADPDPTATGGLMADSFFRAMSKAGSRIFFTTAERLVPEDTNGLGDVYEWADGDVGLVSAGVGNFPSTLLSATPDGATVFFRTGDPLLPSDRDGDDADFYAARIGGGFPEAPPPPEICPCREPDPVNARLDGDAASARPAGGRIVLPPIGVAERQRIVRSGWLELLAEVPGTGRLAATARARLGRRTVTVAATSVQVAEPGPVQLRMRLNAVARRYLAGGKGLSLRLQVGLAAEPGTGAVIGLRLKGGR